MRFRQHRSRKVYPPDCTAGLNKTDGQVAGANSEVEYVHVWRDLGQSDSFTQYLVIPVMGKTGWGNRRIIALCPLIEEPLAVCLAHVTERPE
jgi:hypothetical protein